MKVGWQSTGWTHGKNTSRMLEFMSVKMDVVVGGRVGQERLWDLPERVIPADTPRHELTDDEYAEIRVMRGIQRFGIATIAEIRARAYGMSVAEVKATVARLAEQGKAHAAKLELSSGTVDAVVEADALDALDVVGRGGTTFLSPFDPVIYDRDRTERLFDFRYRLEMYVPEKERQFGHFALPILDAERLVGRLDSEMDHRALVLNVNAVHLEPGAPTTKTAHKAIEGAVAELAEFLGATQVRRKTSTNQPQ